MFKSFTDEEFVKGLQDLDLECAGFLRGNLSTENVAIDTTFQIVAELPIKRTMTRENQEPTNFVLIPTTVGNISYRQFGNLKPAGLADLYSKYGGKTLKITDKEELPRINNNKRFRLKIEVADVADNTSNANANKGNRG